MSAQWSQRYRSGWLADCPVLKALLIGNIGIFLLQNVFAVWLSSPWLLQGLALSPVTFKLGFVWTAFTYGFIHESVMSGGLLHILLNIMVLYFIGRPLEPILGSKRFAQLYLMCTVAGAACWLAVHWSGSGILMGASAGALGLLITFCALYPNDTLTALLFFVIPVRIKPKWLAAIVAGSDVLGFLFSEIAGAADGIAHSAHLGGMLAGYLYYRWALSPHRGIVALPAWVRPRSQKNPILNPTYHVNVRDRSAMRLEVDRILDKINDHGFGSLNKAEKRLLDEAKDLLS